MTQKTTPSPSALMSAAARAAHLLVDDAPPLLTDEQARALCTAADPNPLGYQLAAPDVPVLAAARLSATARSRFAEERLRAASGIEQYVVLGAGLDTSGHRTPPGVSTWLVDLPGVLAWRAMLFSDAGLVDVGAPAPVDLASEDLVARLVAAGLRPERPAFVSWLGTTMYLGREQIDGVLRALSGLAPGSQLVLDHVLPAAQRDAAGQSYADAVASALGASGEPWLSTFGGADMAAVLGHVGWASLGSVAEADSVPDGFWDRRDALRSQRLIQFAHAGLGRSARRGAAEARAMF